MKVYLYYVLADKHKQYMEGRILFNYFEPLIPDLRVGEIGILPNKAGFPAEYIMFLGVEEFEDERDLRRRIYDITKSLIREVVWGNKKEVTFKRRS